MPEAWACGGDAIGGKDRLHLGDGLIAAVADGVLIGVDDNVALFLVVDHHRDNLILELAGVDGGAGAVVADDGQLVTFLPGDVAELGHVVGGHTHVAGDQGVVQCVVEQAVIELRAALGGDATHPIAHTGFGQQEGGLGHIFHAHHQADLGLAQLNVVAGDFQRAHTGGAVLVDGDSAALNGQADPHGDLAGRQGTLHGGIALAHDNFVDGVDVHTSAANGFLPRSDGKFSGGNILELPLELTDGGTAGADNDYISRLHLRYPPVLSCICSFYTYTKMH